MEREGFDIGNNVDKVKVCPNCGDVDERYATIVNTKQYNGKRAKFYTWTCYGCNKELISAQD